MRVSYLFQSVEITCDNLKQQHSKSSRGYSRICLNQVDVLSSTVATKRWIHCAQTQRSIGKVRGSLRLHSLRDADHTSPCACSFLPEPCLRKPHDLCFQPNDLIDDLHIKAAGSISVDRRVKGWRALPWHLWWAAPGWVPDFHSTHGGGSPMLRFGHCIIISFGNCQNTRLVVVRLQAYTHVEMYRSIIGLSNWTSRGA